MLMTSQGLGFAASFAGALVFAFGLGAFLEFAFLRRAKEPTTLGLIIITLGLEMIIYGLASWKWGGDQKDFPFPVSDFETHSLGGVVMSQLNLVTLAVALGLMLLLYLFFSYSKLGLAMKATQQNQAVARLMGIRVNRVLMLTWGISSLVGACAAFLIAPTDTLDPNLMWTPQLKGFAAAVLGGMTSLPGAVGGGFLPGDHRKPIWRLRLAGVQERGGLRGHRAGLVLEAQRAVRQALPAESLEAAGLRAGVWL